MRSGNPAKCGGHHSDAGTSTGLHLLWHTSVSTLTLKTFCWWCWQPRQLRELRRQQHQTLARALPVHVSSVAACHCATDCAIATDNAAHKWTSNWIYTFNFTVQSYLGCLRKTCNYVQNLKSVQHSCSGSIIQN